MIGAITTGDNQRLEVDGFRNLLARLDRTQCKPGKPMRTFEKSSLHILHTIIIWKVTSQPTGTRPNREEARRAIAAQHR